MLRAFRRPLLGEPAGAPCKAISHAIHLRKLFPLQEIGEFCRRGPAGGLSLDITQVHFAKRLLGRQQSQKIEFPLLVQSLRERDRFAGAGKDFAFVPGDLDDGRLIASHGFGSLRGKLELHAADFGLGPADVGLGFANPSLVAIPERDAHGDLGNSLVLDADELTLVATHHVECGVRFNDGSLQKDARSVDANTGDTGLGIEHGCFGAHPIKLDLHGRRSQVAAQLAHGHCRHSAGGSELLSRRFENGLGALVCCFGPLQFDLQQQRIGSRPFAPLEQSLTDLLRATGEPGQVGQDGDALLSRQRLVEILPHAGKHFKPGADQRQASLLDFVASRRLIEHQLAARENVLTEERVVLRFTAGQLRRSDSELRIGIAAGLPGAALGSLDRLPGSGKLRVVGQGSLLEIDQLGRTRRRGNVFDVLDEGLNRAGNGGALIGRWQPLRRRIVGWRSNVDGRRILDRRHRLLGSART